MEVKLPLIDCFLSPVAEVDYYILLSFQSWVKTCLGSVRNGFCNIRSVAAKVHR